MRHVERGPQVREPLLHLFGSLPVTFRGRRDAERAQQVGGGPAGIARFAEDRVKAFVGEVMKDEIDDAPGIECLFAVGRRSGRRSGRRCGLAVDVHAPEKTSIGVIWRSQLETVPRNRGFTL
jgi:hypothetical protein